jgi:hypothetical protein
MPKANITQNISSRPDFNGCFACVIGVFNSQSGRWPVLVIVTQGSRAHLRMQPIQTQAMRAFFM